MTTIALIQKLRRHAASTLIGIAALGAACIAGAVEPYLDIAIGMETQHLSRTELLKHPALRVIEISADVAYNRSMRYQAVPLSALITSLPHMESVQFTAVDGFVANIPSALLTSEAQPWVAVEPADASWPALKPGTTSSAGPFYLVWLAPEKAGIAPEQWPYQIRKIAQGSPLEQRYPQILPKTGANTPAQRGMHVFIVNCAACHKINSGGDALVGPDLNLPFSPTEYFQEPFLRQLIRDPSSVRNWSQRAMPGFVKSVISDAMLDDLLVYLRQMAKQRKEPG